MAFGGNVAMVPTLNFVGSGGRTIGSRGGSVAMVPAFSFIGSGGRTIGSRSGNVAMVPTFNFVGSGGRTIGSRSGNVAMVPALNFVGSGGRTIGSRSGNVAMVPAFNFVGSGGRTIGSRSGNVAMVPALNFEGSGQSAGSQNSPVAMIPTSHFNASGGTQGASGNTENPSPNDVLSAMFGAGSGQQGGGATQLNDAEVQRFVATVKELRAEGQNIRQGQGGFAAAMSYSTKMQNTLKAHGFTMQSWATTLALVTTAMAGMDIKNETSDSNLDAEFASERKSIEQAKDFPPAIKQQMLQQLAQQRSNMMAVRHHDNPNEAAVRPYLKQLQAVFGK